MIMMIITTPATTISIIMVIVTVTSSPFFTFKTQDSKNNNLCFVLFFRQANFQIKMERGAVCN